MLDPNETELTLDQSTVGGLGLIHQNRPHNALQERRYQEWVNEQLDELMGVRKCSNCKRKLSYSNKGIPKLEKLFCTECLIKIPGVTIGKRIRVFRWDANLSQDGLSGSTGIQVADLRAIEHFTKAPTNDQLDRLIKALGSELVSGMTEVARSE